MTRKLIALSLAALFVAGFTTAGEKAWWDENCSMCKPMMENAALMKNVQWEQHDISNGFVAVTTVKKDYLDAYRAAHEKMDKTSKRLQAGEKLELCGSCEYLGMCMMKGAHQEYVKTSTGDVWIVTSDNPEVIADLHKWVKKNKETKAEAQMGQHHG